MYKHLVSSVASTISVKTEKSVRSWDPWCWDLAVGGLRPTRASIDMTDAIHSTSHVVTIHCVAHS